MFRRPRHRPRRPRRRRCGRSLLPGRCPVPVLLWAQGAQEYSTARSTARI